MHQAARATVLSRDIDPGQEAAGNIFGLQFVNKRCSVWALCGAGCQKVTPQDKTMPTAHREQAGLYALGPAGAGHTGSWRQKLRRAPWLVCLLLDVLCEGGGTHLEGPQRRAVPFPWRTGGSGDGQHRSWAGPWATPASLLPSGPWKVELRATPHPGPEAKSLKSR